MKPCIPQMWDRIVDSSRSRCSVFDFVVFFHWKPCALCERSKYDKSIDIDEVSQAEYLHNEFWLNQRDLVRTMDSLVEDYKDEDEDLEGSHDSDDIEFTSWGL